MSGPAGHSYEENSSDRAFAVCDPLSALAHNSEAHNIGNKLPCLLQLESSLHSVVSFTQTLQCGSSPSHSVEHLVFVKYACMKFTISGHKPKYTRMCAMQSH